MYLFMFREVAKRELRAWRSTHIRPSIYALHPTKETITKEEWEGIVEEAEARYQKDRERYSKATNQVLQEMREKGLRLSESKGEKYSEQRLYELGVIPFGMVKSLAEVLAEKGFEIITPKEFTFQTPLNKIEAEVAAEHDHVGIPSLDGIMVSEALGTLQLFCGLNRFELESLISEG